MFDHGSQEEQRLYSLGTNLRFGAQRKVLLGIFFLLIEFANLEIRRAYR